MRLLLPSYRLRFYRPARSSLVLVYGRSDLLAPRYDLALVSRDLLNAEAVAVVPLGERQAKPARRAFVSPVQFWIGRRFYVGANTVTSVLTRRAD